MTITTPPLVQHGDAQHAHARCHATSDISNGAQCSGQRDPTKFVKKSQLVTPAGIDHDFNFLTGIERDIEKAEQSLAEKTVVDSSTSHSWSQHKSSQKGQVNYQQLEAAGVKVIRAPKVEWFDHQKKRQLTETSSTCQVAVAQPFAPREQYKAKKRKLDTKQAAAPGSSSVPDPTPSLEHKDKQVRRGLNVKSTIREEEQLPAGERAINPHEREAGESESSLTEAVHAESRNDRSSVKPTDDGEHMYFLAKPRTTSSRSVLIPLDSNATLGECLNGRTVLEFPTIYVFPSSMELSDEFMLEQDYLKQEGEDQKEFDELINELDPEILKRLKENNQQSGHNARDEVVDSKEILDVLKKDFGAVI
ncbi:hypothetical protein SNOG_07122 [Parastagonospora nodorum SN15]|uniref:BCD1 alpha/beta domain-containing protein n=1 Tax=Phaeosphaeria nodorum (strain SN15 / ATCC MYA-4574 / FGSC 10173) TaxID=321614 RepID=Q0UM92_PHANO|nr:hypothetical protein SNOG_07122 [Parastagonospora nodorum SN15]EAT85773.2 hypothetical protein SNOG_07122 [Parastagonospora nodorum SN15]